VFGAIFFDCNKMSSSTAFDNHGHGLVGGSSRQSRRDAASRELDLLIRDLADARLDFGDNVERIEEEITEETVTTTTTTKRKKKKRRAVSSSRAQEHQRKRERALEYHAQPRRTHTPEVVMVEQPLKLESSTARKKNREQRKLPKEQKHHHKSDSGVKGGGGGGFTFVTSIEKEFPARYEWMDCLVQNTEDDGHDLHSGRKSKFERRDSNQSNSSGSSSSSTAATASTTNRNNSRQQQHVDHHAHASSAAASTKHQQSKQSKSTKNSGSIVAPPSDFNDANAVRSSAGPTTVVNREFDENGGVTKTVTTTTTEEREYKVINYDGSDLDEAIATDMAELDDLRRIAASAAAASAVEKPKKGHGQRVVTFHDDLRLALSEERDRRHAAVRSLNATQKTRHGSGDSRTSGTVHVPVNSEVRQPPGGGSSKAEDAAYRLRFLWRQPQAKSPSAPRHVCFGCNSAIEGRCVTALFKKFHPEHFVCSYCLAQLSQGTFKERGQKPYCQNCYNRL